MIFYVYIYIYRFGMRGAAAETGVGEALQLGPRLFAERRERLHGREQPAGLLRALEPEPDDHAAHPGPAESPLYGALWLPKAFKLAVRCQENKADSFANRHRGNFQLLTAPCNGI